MFWKPLKILTLYDKIAVALILLVIIGWLGWGTVLHSASHGEKVAVVEIDGEEISRLDMSGIEDEKVYFETHGIDFIVHIRDSRVRILRMDDEYCPRHICSDTGWISNSYEAIVCVPNKMVIGIEDSGELDEIPVDIVVY